jgi:crotonobetainyl-CoA:carnitine CoA-transferase CaiB-like acyl-CoA transferase
VSSISPAAKAEKASGTQGQEVEVAMLETMASFMLVEHANGAMFDPRWGPRSTRGQLHRIAGRTDQ